jgi:hypothetical protein
MQGKEDYACIRLQKNILKMTRSVTASIIYILWHHSHCFCTEKKATCCTQCAVKQPWICFHSCNPSTLVLDPSDPSHIPKGRTKQKVKVADYIMQDNNVRLREHLRNWHKTALIGQGHGSDMFFGPQQILSDQLITRIADLAHHHKITLVQTLADQTSWDAALKYGEEILSIVRTHFPPPSSSS